MVPPLQNVDVDDLLSGLRKNIAASLTETAPSSAVTYLTSPAHAPATAASAVGERRPLDSSLAAVRALSQAIGSLPPSPPTLRGRAGKAFVRLSNRLTWWQASLMRQLAEKLGDIAEDLGRSVADLDPRQRNVERGLDQLRRRAESLDEIAKLIGKDMEELRARVDELEKRAIAVAAQEPK